MNETGDERLYSFTVFFEVGFTDEAACSIWVAPTADMDDATEASMFAYSGLLVRDGPVSQHLYVTVPPRWHALAEYYGCRLEASR